MTTDTAVGRLVEQLRTEVGAIVGAITALMGPPAAHLEEEISAGSVVWASDLLGDDDNAAAQTVIDLMCVRWPDGTDPPTEWWATPLGQAVAASTGHPTSDVVSYSVAGAMLGCTKQNVQKHVASGALARGPAGHGVTRESVRARMRSAGGQ